VLIILDFSRRPTGINPARLARVLGADTTNPHRPSFRMTLLWLSNPSSHSLTHTLLRSWGFPMEPFKAASQDHVSHTMHGSDNEPDFRAGRLRGDMYSCIQDCWLPAGCRAWRASSFFWVLHLVCTHMQEAFNQKQTRQPLTVEITTPFASPVQQVLL
jgi:hypothetical protein